ncbi:hypothetical protein [Paraglaciecola sp. 20A4]|uniref:hypothetical protein n=1 Tax=Paraglaciecola sp. 20A4 TaxID=2687288 RepID=UPI00140E0955|nr:hypothetical protein [Paraglaciecola sp. 20A4]
MRRLLTCVFLSCAMTAPVAIAQQADTKIQQPVTNAAQPDASESIFFGDANQPGRAIHMAIVELVNNGVSLDDAVSQTIGDITKEDGSSLSGTARLIVGLNKDISASFMSNMVSFNKLTDTTKGAIEAFPSNAADVVQLAVTLYPSFAQDVIDAAVITGEIEPNDALLAAIAAGADPTTVSSATAAGANVDVAATPAGAGVGAGGAGGGDTTASTN